MSRLGYHIRSATNYWQTNLAVSLGAAVATASLTGALMVGDSMRGSLLEIAVGRLGGITHSLVAQRFFRSALAAEIVGELRGSGATASAAPAILLRGGVSHADLESRVEGIGILGVNEQFWQLDSFEHPIDVIKRTDRSVILNEPLAAELQAKVGDDVILRLAKPAAVSTETLLGRRDDVSSSIRLEVAAILPAEGLAAFGLNPRQTTPKNAFVPLSVLQRSLDREEQINAILGSIGQPDQVDTHSRSDGDSDMWQRALQKTARLGDVGLRLRQCESLGYVAVESDALLIPPALESAIRAAALDAGLTASPILAHLANTIAVESTSQSVAARIPYSTVAAIEPLSETMRKLTASLNTEVILAPGDILLNQWAADDLRASVGDRIALTYYLINDRGTIETHSTTFTLRGIVPLAGAAADPGFIPEYEGISNAKSLADWNPPFPIDLSLVRDRDEDYWKDHRTTPKAFISLVDGQRLWASESERFGRITSFRLSSTAAGESATNGNLDAVVEAFTTSLSRNMNVADLGLRFQPIREQVESAAQGGTDFGILFVSFSFFLIAAAAMLIALLFRLGVERRAHEIGMLLSFGFTPRAVGRILLTEGALIASIGGVLGIGGALGYAWLMLEGLRTWWSDAVNAPQLHLHVRAATVAIGFLAGVLVSTVSIVWSVRGLTHLSPRRLIDGRLGDSDLTAGRHQGRTSAVIAVIAFALAAGLAATAFFVDTNTRIAVFFAGGSAMLVSCLAIQAYWLRRRSIDLIHRPGTMALFRIGTRNARRNRGRSLLTASLIASAVFVVVSLEAFRHDANAGGGDRQSGTGGFSVVAESAVPLPFDPSTPEGRDSLGMTDSRFDSGEAARIYAFRLRPGDESSCLNLYRPTQPRIVGADDDFVRRGGFRFAASLAVSEEEKQNPWTLLHHAFPDGAIPAIGDDSAVTWQLRLGLGKDLVIEDDRGRSVQLRFVALLKGSVLQSEIVIGDAAFKNLFPSISGRAFFLIDAPASEATGIELALERELSPYGLDASNAQGRLADYFAVQNTYISTFQSLGGLGLLLGTAGLAAVLLRNIWERRRELALMRTVGFAQTRLCIIVVVENAVLLVAGIVSGLIAAALATVPAVWTNAQSIPWKSLITTLTAVLVFGLSACLASTLSALRTSLIPALRSE